MKNLLLLAAGCLLSLNLNAAASDEWGSLPLIAVNQVGYETHAFKRFTAPGIENGTVFHITLEDATEILHKGEVNDAIGDFTNFRPSDSPASYVVRIPSKDAVSFPFAVRENLCQEAFWHSTLNFMIDCRSVTGAHPSAFGGGPWRDGTYYSYEVPSLILLYSADPEFWQDAPRQIDWEADKERVLSPDFEFTPTKADTSIGAFEAACEYFTKVPPPAENAPDIIKLIHWGLGFYMMKPDTRDPSRDFLPQQVHSQVVEQFAFLIHYWDRLDLGRWLPQAFYDDCLSFTRRHWESSGCFEIDPLWHPRTYSFPMEVDDGFELHVDLHPYKGRHAPGHSILPNLFMYLALKGSAPEAAQRHLEAAQAQTAFIIEKLDWKDPRTTKGHRGSEFQTMLNLSWFLRNLPEQAPAGLQEKILHWAQVAVSRSENMWDFRRYDLQNHWTIPSMNETGNLAAFPAAALSAASVIEDQELRRRLHVLAIAHLDNLWGRNPVRTAAPARAHEDYRSPEQGYPMVERAWPLQYHGAAVLSSCRGGIDASPGTEMYPNNPEGKYRHPEGWVNWNASWNVGLWAIESAKGGDLLAKNPQAGR